jgi:hypothetical protein
MVKRARRARRKPKPAKKPKQQGSSSTSKASPIKTTALHFTAAVVGAEIEVDGERYALIGTDELDPWEAFVEPPAEWPMMLIEEGQRDDFDQAWAQDEWPVEMVTDIMAGALSEILSNNWGSCQAVVGLCFETDIAPRVALELARSQIDPWQLPAHQLPVVLYGMLTEWLNDKGKRKVDKIIESFADEVYNNSEHAEVQNFLDEFDALMVELGEDLTAGPEAQ